MDTEGKDNDNIHKIVDKAKEYEAIHALVLVINHMAPRFDAGLKDAVKMLVESFGPESASQMSILYTRASARKSGVKADVTIAIQDYLVNNLSATVPVLNDFYYDAYPNEDLSLDKIEYYKARAATELATLCAWARRQRPMATEYFRYGEYDWERRERWAKEAIFIKTVLRNDTEERIHTRFTETTPRYERRKECRPNPLPKALVGASAAVATIFSPLVGAAVGTLMSAVPDEECYWVKKVVGETVMTEYIK